MNAIEEADKKFIEEKVSRDVLEWHNNKIAQIRKDHEILVNTIMDETKRDIAEQKAEFVEFLKLIHKSGLVGEMLRSIQERIIELSKGS